MTLFTKFYFFHSSSSSSTFNRTWSLYFVYTLSITFYSYFCLSSSSSCMSPTPWSLAAHRLSALESFSVFFDSALGLLQFTIARQQQHWSPEDANSSSWPRWVRLTDTARRGAISIFCSKISLGLFDVSSSVQITWWSLACCCCCFSRTGHPVVSLLSSRRGQINAYALLEF